jgi:hypothetical protein
VELTWTVDDFCGIMGGTVWPGLDHDKDHHETNDAYYIYGDSGSLWGNGKRDVADKQGEFARGDRIGVLLDLDAGWLRIYRNGKRCGPGFTEGVTGPLVQAAQLLPRGRQGDGAAWCGGA